MIWIWLLSLQSKIENLKSKIAALPRYVNLWSKWLLKMDSRLRGNDK
jgi:uncharacterized membrane protein YccC